jgi:hypothetical protein
MSGRPKAPQHSVVQLQKMMPKPTKTEKGTSYCRFLFTDTTEFVQVEVVEPHDQEDGSKVDSDQNPPSNPVAMFKEPNNLNSNQHFWLGRYPNQQPGSISVFPISLPPYYVTYHPYLPTSNQPYGEPTQQNNDNFYNNNIEATLFSQVYPPANAYPLSQQTPLPYSTHANMLADIIIRDPNRMITLDELYFLLVLFYPKYFPCDRDDDSATVARDGGWKVPVLVW